MTRGELAAVIKDSLTPLRLYSDRALVLLLGTCAIESAFGRYRRQLGHGPALGIYQMEPSTFRWLRTKYGKRYPAISEYSFADQQSEDDQATVMARLRYLSIPDPLPASDDLEGQATYWRKWYNGNSPRGRTARDYIEAYHLYVGDLRC